MLPIKKDYSPAGLRDYLKKHSENADYDDFKKYKGYQDKNGKDAFFELRAKILQEQKYVCAYCGQELLEVENENGFHQMKTEHFLPQTGKSDNDLDYSNLLACCLGGERELGAKHCDTKKGGDSLKHLQNPALLKIRDRAIVYEIRPNSEEVVIFSEDEGKNTELKETLNLNHDRLRRRRFSVWKSQIKPLIGNERKLAELREAFVDVPYGRHKAFKDFVLWYLDNQLQSDK